MAECIKEGFQFSSYVNLHRGNFRTFQNSHSVGLTRSDIWHLNSEIAGSKCLLAWKTNFRRPWDARTVVWTSESLNPQEFGKQFIYGISTQEFWIFEKSPRMYSIVPEFSFPCFLCPRRAPETWNEQKSRSTDWVTVWKRQGKDFIDIRSRSLLPPYHCVLRKYFSDWYRAV